MARGRRPSRPHPVRAARTHKDWQGARGDQETDDALSKMVRAERGREIGEVYFWDGEKLARIEPGPSGAVLKSNGAGNPPTWLGGSTGGITTVLKRDTDDVTVVNTAAKTTLYTYTIPAGTIGTDKCVRVTILGDMKNNTGLTKTYKVHLALGPTEIWQNTITSIGTDTDRTVIYAVIHVAGKGTDQAQWVQGFYSHPTTGTPAAGLGHINAATGSPEAIGSFGDAGSEDSSGDLAITFAVTPDTASADYEFVKRYAVVELL